MPQTNQGEKRRSFSCLIPFDGFYCTHHAQRIDDEEEALFRFDDGEIRYPDLYGSFWEKIDYLSVFRKCAKCYLELVGSILEVGFTFEELLCPREYNFSTDRIFASISRADFCKLLIKVRGKSFRETALDMFASRPGFASFYSPKISSWAPIADWDHNQAGAVVAAALKRELAESRIDLDSQLDEFIDSSSIQDWLCNAVDDSGIRVLRINDYLRLRDERVSAKISCR